MAFCLLCGCLCALLGACAGKTGGAEEDILDFRARMIAARSLSMTVELQADYGDRVYPFKLAYTGDGNGGSLTVLEPALIEGVVVELGEQVRLRYDGAEFDTGAIVGSGLSPVETLPLMLSAWQDALVTDSYSERLDDRACVVAVMDLSGQGQDAVHTLWLDKETGLPVAGEISQAGTRVITCRFSEVTIG